jgi:hypothetical protein
LVHREVRTATGKKGRTGEVGGGKRGWDGDKSILKKIVQKREGKWELIKPKGELRVALWGFQLRAE